MKILVIGSNGQLGSDCMSVVGSKDTVIGVDFPEIDISKESCSRKLLDRLRPDVVVNCAAHTAVDACENDSLCWKVNADGPKHLAEWTEGNG
ncbi:MAG: sugar nucleotide-binding protein, partial [Lentisphaeria bacterium]|nr:sugar nucleotide-binding protein [Lentisphaeria bacterium]